MSIQTIAWAFRLRGLTPLARLIAIRMADTAPLDGTCRLDVDDLSKWCESDPPDVLRELMRVLIVAGLHSVGKPLPEFVKLPGALPVPPRQIDTSPLWIYVARGTDRTKIGVTRDRRARMESLACATGQRVELIWSHKSVAHVAREVERRALAKFLPQRIVGEWFNIEAAAAINEIERLLADPGAPLTGVA